MLEAMKQRHSVRKYLDKPLSNEHIACLQKEIDRCNQEGNLHFQLITNEPKAFGSFLVHYGMFHNVTNYIACIGKKSNDLEEKCGYYGEQLVLYAQKLGLNTCWVYLTYKKVKNTFIILEDEQLVIVIAIGYGENQGYPHKNKPLTSLCNLNENSPTWFKQGMEAVLLAPTAINQQKFYFTQIDDTVEAVAKKGPCSKIDLGIVKYHFELGANHNFKWK